MIDNNIASQLSRYYNNRAGNQGGGVQDLYKRLREKHEAIHGRSKSAEEAETETAKTDKAAVDANGNRVGKGYIHNKTKPADTDESQTKDKTASSGEEEKLSPEERRQKEIRAILEKLDAEEAARYPSRYKKTDAKKGGDKTADKTDGETTVVTPESLDEAKQSGGLSGFLNDMPLFNEFKAGLMDAFSRLDKAAVGSISAQYELNYSTMQYVANAAGGFDYKETSVSVKLDLNYVKAASGGKSGKEISDLIAGSEDFESLIANLQSAGQNQAAAPTQTKPEDFLTSMQDYFSPEKTANRILDFCTAFFPGSDQFKAKGDTPEAREEFAEIMRNAIQKGFDQAMGVLGAVPKDTMDGINKTHDIVFKGIDDFVKNGLNKDKQQSGVYDALEQFMFSAQISYSEKTVSVRTGSAYGNAAQQNQPASTVDTQA